MLSTMGFWGYLAIVVGVAVMVWVLYFCLSFLSPKKRRRGIADFSAEKAEQAPPKGNLAGRSAATFESHGYSKGCVMVVEDEPDVRENMCMKLERAGYDVIELEDGEKAIEAMNSGNTPFEVDVIITDTPKKKGLEAITYFKKHYPRISLIGLTGATHFETGNTPPTKIAILGGGKGGSALLSLFSHLPGIEIVGITDKDPNAPALKRANELRIPVVHDAMSLIASEGTNLIVDVTGDSHMQQLIAEHKGQGTEVLGGAAARLLWNVVQHEAEMQTHLLQTETLASLVTHGMIVNYLVKPVQEETLLAAVTKAMEQRALHRL
jgi:CheY-like chemotaxis protein